MSEDFFLSIIIPVYNEEKNIDPLLKRLLPVVNKFNHEIIFVDDGSKDSTVKTIKNIIKTNKNIKLISFLRNFGHQQALTAGYQNSQGDCVVSLDADLQDPPEIISQMLKKWQAGAKIVYARRGKREVDGFFKKQTAGLFYKLMGFLSDTPIPDNIGDYRLLDKEVAGFLNQLPERARFLRGLVAWGGFKEDCVYFEREKRFAGETHYPLTKMFNFALDGITSFSVKPLRLAAYFGFVTGILGLLGMVYAIYRRLFLPHDYWVTGWTAIFVGIMFMGGIQLLTVGIIGEYIGKIYQQIQGRPGFLIKEKVNLDDRE